MNVDAHHNESLGRNRLLDASDVRRPLFVTAAILFLDDDPETALIVAKPMKKRKSVNWVTLLQVPGITVFRSARTLCR
jgi:hypothetical protein